MFDEEDKETFIMSFTIGALSALIYIIGKEVKLAEEQANRAVEDACIRHQYNQEKNDAINH